MFKQKWDNENNSIILSNKISEEQSIVSPRPVFFEELDLLGFDNHWAYPKCEEPLLWAIGRRYYYKGTFIAEAKGGNIYEKPILNIMHKLTLEPINIEELIVNNLEVLKVLEGEAIDFIQDTYKRYKNKVDLFSVAFSGGKDSQVVLDLVSRVLAPDEYFAIFTDTTMEIPFTHETVENTKKKYKKIYPNLQFYTAKPEEHSLEYWEKFGPPSRFHRWCCSVYKTVPYAKLVKTIIKNKNDQPIIIVFEGVRAEESSSRSNYNREGKSVKHINIINQRIIFKWNTFEIFLYLFYRDIELNKGYRYGFQRIGCAVCPFSSDWSEYLINSLCPAMINDYIKKIKVLLPNLGLNDPNQQRDYIKKGNWKKRAGGRGLNISDSNLEFYNKDKVFTVIINNPKEKFSEWIKVMGDSIVRNFDNNMIGEIQLKNTVIKYNSVNKNGTLKLNFYNINKDITNLSYLKKILYKATCCVHCGVCEIECPNNAIILKPYLKINNKKCTHCLNCLNFSEKGCLNAKSISLPKGGKNMQVKSSGIDRYSTFGLRKEWLEGFLNDPEDWLENNNLGPKQKPAIKWWLREADLLSNNIPTNLIQVLQNIKLKKYHLIWEIIWINLYNNSIIVNWYCNIDFGKYTKNELREMIKSDYSNYSEGTLSNPIDALINTFDNSPLGPNLMLGDLEKKGRQVISIRKLGTDEIHPISIAYSLYKYAEYKKRYNFTVSEFYSENSDGGPYKLFGISKEAFENILRGLQENKNQIVRVDLTANLDNIFLQENLTSIEVLKLLTK